MGAINGSKTNWPRPAEPLASVFARHGKGICATPLFYSPKGLGRRAGASGAVGEAPAAGDTASRHRNAAMKIPGISTTLPTGTGRSRCCFPRYVSPDMHSGIFIEASHVCPPRPARNIAHTSRRSGVFLVPRPRKFGRHPRLVCPQAAAKRKHREEDREVDSGETHSAKKSAREVKQLLPAGERVQLDENAGDERGVTMWISSSLNTP